MPAKNRRRDLHLQQQPWSWEYRTSGNGSSCKVYRHLLSWPEGVAIAFPDIAFPDIEIVVAHPSWLCQDESISPWSMDTPGIGSAMRRHPSMGDSQASSGSFRGPPPIGEMSRGYAGRAPTTATLLPG